MQIVIWNAWKTDNIVNRLGARTRKQEGITHFLTANIKIAGRENTLQALYLPISCSKSDQKASMTLSGNSNEKKRDDNHTNCLSPGTDRLRCLPRVWESYGNWFLTKTRAWMITCNYSLSNVTAKGLPAWLEHDSSISDCSGSTNFCGCRGLCSPVIKRRRSWIATM